MGKIVERSIRLAVFQSGRNRMEGSMQGHHHEREPHVDGPVTGAHRMIYGSARGEKCPRRSLGERGRRLTKVIRTRDFGTWWACLWWPAEGKVVVFAAGRQEDSAIVIYWVRMAPEPTRKVC